VREMADMGIINVNVNVMTDWEMVNRKTVNEDVRPHGDICKLSRMGFPTRLKSKKVEIGKEKTS